MRLKDKVAIITGGTRGLGRATAVAFAREGAKVAVCDVGADDAGLLNELEAAGTKGFYAQADVTNPGQVQAFIAAAESALGPVSILVNNAGITKDSSLLKMTLEQWDAVIGVNLSGVFHVTKAIAAGMVERKYGRIINISSIVGLYGNFGQTNYAATKSGVIGMTKTWARELGRKGVTVNAVAPGFIMTEMVKLMPEQVLEQMVSRVPLGRAGDPKDVANACLFLASDEASYVNGAVLSVDGGLVM